METIRRKNTWQECTDGDILEVYKEVYQEAKRLYPQYFNSNIRFYIANTTKALGRCIQIYNNIYGYYTRFEDIRNEDAVILLSKYVKNKDMARRVIVHEFGHLVAPAEKHSYLWETRANKIGNKFGITCKRLASREDSTAFKEAQPVINRTKYCIQCTGCGGRIFYQKLCDTVKNPQRWICTKCGAKFKRVWEA